MFYNLLPRLSLHITFAIAIVAGPLAYAAPSMNDSAGVSTIDALQLQNSQVKTSELGVIRGGFDISPKLSINFAFQQTDYQGSHVIQSIIVPMTTLTQTTHDAATTIISSNGAVAFMQSGKSNATPGDHSSGFMQSPASSENQNNSVQPNSSGSTSSGNTTTFVPSNTSNIAVTSTANNGQSVVISQLGSGGITNIITNQANNTLLSQVTNVNIAVSGMSQWLSQQRGNLVSSGGAFGNSNFFR